MLYKRWTGIDKIKIECSAIRRPNIDMQVLHGRKIDWSCKLNTLIIELVVFFVVISSDGIVTDKRSLIPVRIEVCSGNIGIGITVNGNVI